MSTAPLGVIVHWPGTDPARALMEADHFFGTPNSSPVLLFQESKELNITYEEHHRPNNPERQLFANTHGNSEEDSVSSDEPSREGETDADRQLRLWLNRARAFRRRLLHARNLNRDFVPYLPL